MLRFSALLAGVVIAGSPAFADDGSEITVGLVSTVEGRSRLDLAKRLELQLQGGASTNLLTPPPQDFIPIASAGAAIEIQGEERTGEINYGSVGLEVDRNLMLDRRWEGAFAIRFGARAVDTCLLYTSPSPRD